MSLMSTLSYRQKALTIDLLVNVVLLIAFLLSLTLYRGSHSLGPLFLALSWIFPILYDGVTIHTTEDTRTDERERDFENRGRRDGYGFLSFGVLTLLWMRSDDPVSLLNQLLVIWILSRLVVNGKQLRLYGGHEGWLPDRFVAWARNGSRRRSEARFAAARARRAHLDPQDQGDTQ